MKIKYIGHASFLITGSDGISVLTDPYRAGAFGGAIGFDPISERADIVTVSHDHEDHADTSSLPGRPLIIRQEAQAKGITFDVVPTYHDDQRGSARGPNRIFAFEIDGIRVAHFGDLGHLLSPRQIQALAKIHVALIPVGGKFTIDPTQAWQILTDLRPNIAIPMHFKTPKVGFPIASLDQFLQGKTNIRREIGSEISLEPKDLPDPILIICLAPSN